MLSNADIWRRAIKLQELASMFSLIICLQSCERMQIQDCDKLNGQKITMPHKKNVKEAVHSAPSPSGLASTVMLSQTFMIKWEGCVCHWGMWEKVSPNVIH